MITEALHQRMQRLIHADDRGEDAEWSAIWEELEKQCGWGEASRRWLTMCTEFDMVHCPEEFGEE